MFSKNCAVQAEFNTEDISGEYEIDYLLKLQYFKTIALFI